MDHTLRLRCNVCVGQVEIDCRTTIVAQGVMRRALMWRCPDCQSIQHSTMPSWVQAALKLGARKVGQSQPQYLAADCPVCELSSLLPLPEIETYAKLDGTVALWHCRVCSADRSTGIHPNLVFKIVNGGGTAMSENEGAMIELLADPDYQPHAAMQNAGFPFAHQKGTHDAQ